MGDFPKYGYIYVIVTMGMSAFPDIYIYIYMHLQRPSGKCVYISQSTSAHGITNMFYLKK